MPSRLNQLACVWLLAVAVFTGCAHRAPPSYDMSLSDFHGAEGYTYIYDVSPQTLRVTLTDDYGHPPKIVWQTDLTPAQQQAFTRFAEALPLDKLKERYEPDGIVFDGYQYTYKLRIGTKQAREIEVNNVSQPQLDPLIDLINGVVPEKYRAATPRGSVSFPRPPE